MNKKIICIIVLLIILFQYIVFRCKHNYTERYEDMPISYSFPIDVVVTWVDSSDKEWEELRNSLSEKPIDFDRFPDQNVRSDTELQRCLASILRFAPWVRYIWIVTHRAQIPLCVKNNEIDLKKIRIVHHDQIYKNLNDLPTFNSLSIESNIHRIQGLSEHFIYFNDDVYMLNYNFPSDYFSKYGYPLYNLKTELNLGLTEHSSAWKNISEFNIFRVGLNHMSIPLTKTIMDEAESVSYGLWSATSSSKFRDHSNIPPIGLSVINALNANLAVKNMYPMFYRYIQNKNDNFNDLPPYINLCSNAYNPDIIRQIDRLLSPNNPRIVDDNILIFSNFEEDLTGLYDSHDLLLAKNIAVVVIDNEYDVRNIRFAKSMIGAGVTNYQILSELDFANFKIHLANTIIVLDENTQYLDTIKNNFKTFQFETFQDRANKYQHIDFDPTLFLLQQNRLRKLYKGKI
jgi:hypothetical protein